MLRLKKDLWKASIALAGTLFLLVLTVWVPMSAVAAHEKASGYVGLATVTAQPAPTEDATKTALEKEQLTQEVAQQQHTWNNWLWSNAAMIFSSFLSTLVIVIGVLFGLWRWRRDRQDAQDKELKDRQAEREKRSEERFQRVVTDLGSERKEARIAAAIMLLTFLQPGYEQFGRQIFDFAVSYLQPLGVGTPTSDFAPLDPLRRALINVFKQSFLYVRGEWEEQKPKSLGSDLSDHDRLGAAGIQLDNAYLAKADLRGVWMREASLRRANLFGTKFTGAHLKGVDFTDAHLEKALLTKTDSSRANFTRAKLMEADFTGADISRADFTEAIFTGAHPEAADSLKGTKMCRVVDLTKEQLEACKAKGAIIDEDSTTGSFQPTVATPPPPQSNALLASSAPSAKESIPIPTTDGSNATSSSQQDLES
jgi:hypothetical protein